MEAATDRQYPPSWRFARVRVLPARRVRFVRQDSKPFAVRGSKPAPEARGAERARTHARTVGVGRAWSCERGHCCVRCGRRVEARRGRGGRWAAVSSTGPVSRAPLDACHWHAQEHQSRRRQRSEPLRRTSVRSCAQRERAGARPTARRGGRAPARRGAAAMIKRTQSPKSLKPHTRAALHDTRVPIPLGKTPGASRSLAPPRTHDTACCKTLLWPGNSGCVSIGSIPVWYF